MNQRPLADFVSPPDVTKAVLHTEWHEVRRRVRRHKQVRVAAVLSAALVLAGIVAGVALRPSRETIAPGAAIAGQPRQVWLAEGSSIATAPHTELQLERADASDVLLVLERGEATFDVAKNPARKFVVQADSVEVKVVGTRFTVTREARAVSVAVARGIVEVRDGETVVRLTAGQRWSRSEEIAEVATPHPDGVAPDVVAPGGFEPLGGEGVTVPAKEKPTRAVRRAKQEAPAPSAEPEPVEPAVVQPEPVAPVPAPVEPTAADVFAAAMQDRASGKTKAAIQGFQQVCERWPQSAYAPMSAFEWGRLALDAADDPRQAARAFERTLELASSQQLVEDALARLAEAYARYDAASCRRVQGEYLRRFPSGPHVRGVSKACPP